MPGTVAVAAPHHLAVDAARTVIEHGGNAVDGAVAAAATLCVVYPHQCSIGGDLFALVRRPDGSVHSLNGSGRYGSTPVSTPDAMPVKGPLTVTVPGAVAGWQSLLEQFGSGLPVARVLAPAIAVAHAGATIGPGLGVAIAEAVSADEVNDDLRALLTSGHGTPLGAGQVLRQQRLGETLQGLADRGLRDFYDGELADRIARACRRLGIPVERSDLSRCQAVVEEPLSVQLDRCRLWTSPPNSQGYLLLSIVLAVEEVHRRGGTVDARVLARLFARAEHRRARELADPDFMRVAVADLLQPEAISADVRAMDGPHEATPSTMLHPGGDTVAVTAISEDGSAVSLIQSLFHYFGSGLRDADTGIVFHNRATSFATDPTDPNCVAPGKRPSHTLMPVLMELPDGSTSALGTMGGRAQPQIHAQLVEHLLRGATPGEAVSAPRFVVRPLAPGADRPVVLAEQDLGAAVLDDLRDSRLPVQETHPRDESVGHAVVCTRSADGSLSAAADPRSDGSALLARPGGS